MKEKLLYLVAIIAVAAIAVVIVQSAGKSVAPTTAVPSTPRTISVTGEAEVRVVPDEVVITLGIATHDAQLAVAKRNNDTIVARVLSLTKEFDIAPEHVQTDYIDIQPRYRDGCYEICDPIGYAVHKSVVITLNDLDKFEDLLTGVLNVGVNYLHRIEFRTTDLRKYRDQARALAIQAAREKAAALANELDEGTGKPLNITEQYSGWWSGYGAWWGSHLSSSMSQNTVQEYQGESLGVDSSLAPGQISIKASVSVSFELVE
jgi:uncharacterized protein YggE